MSKVSKLKTALNFANQLTGRKFGILRSEEALSPYTGTQQKKAMGAYAASLDISADQIPKPAVIDEVKDASIVKPGKFASGEFKKATAADPSLTTEIEEALKVETATSDATTTSLDAAKLGLKNVSDDFIKEPEKLPANWNPFGAIAHLHMLKSDAHEALSTQQAEEKKKLTDKLNDSAFKEKLSPDVDYDKLKTEMLGDLDKSHKDAMKKLDDGFTKPLEALHDHANLEIARIAFFARSYDNNKAMRDEINRMHRANQKDTTVQITLQQQGNRGKALFKGLSVKDMKTVETLTGRKINKGEDGTFSMDLPNRIFSPLYYASSQDKMRQDFMGLVGAVRAAGHKGISLDINNSDPKQAEEMARKAYEACLLNGFDPKDIEINVNGVKKGAEKGKSLESELFANRPNELQRIKDKAKEYKEQRDPTGATDGASFNTRSKTNAESYRDELRARKSAEAPGASMTSAAPELGSVASADADADADADDPNADAESSPPTSTV